MIDIHKLKVFRATIEQGSYVKAAKIIGISRSGLSKMLNVLQEDLGINLIRVSGKKIFPTKEGQLLYEQSKEMIDNFDEKIGLFLDSLSKEENIIRINTTTSYASTWIPLEISNFNNEYRYFKFSIFGSDSTPNIEKENIDVAIRPYIKCQNDLVQKPLQTFDMSLYASEEYIKKFGEPQSVEELEKHNIISFNTKGAKTFDFFNWHLKHLPKNFEPLIKINSGIGMMRLVERGLGVAPISKEGVKLSGKKLIPILPNLKSSPVEIFYIYKKQKEIPEKIKLLYDFLKSKY